MTEVKLIMKAASPYCLFAVIILGVIACTEPDDPAVDEGLLDVVWSIDSLQTPDTAFVAPRLGYATIQFTEDMAVRGHSRGRISYHGIYEITADRLLSIEVVEPAGIWRSSPSMTYTIINALEQITTHEVNENRLRLHQNNRYALYFHSSLFEEELLYTVWKVDSLQTPDVKIVRGPDTLITIIQPNDTTRIPCRSETYPTIQFEKDMRISGILFCNTYNGTYEIIEKGKLAMDVLTWTEMACGWGFPERIFRDALENVTFYDVVDGALTLSDSGRLSVIKLNRE